MADFNKLIGGFRVFKATSFNEHNDVVKHLIQQGVKPKTMVITSSNLRISPDIIFSSSPGDFFVFRNFGGFVVPYDNEGLYGMVAAIEYAVVGLKVDTIIVLGHAKSDAIKLLMDSDEIGESTANVKNSTTMQKWLSVAQEARDSVNSQLSDKTQEEKESACEQEAILVSLKNLLTYPFVEERLADDSLKIYGWHFNIETGTLLGFNPETKFFDPIG